MSTEHQTAVNVLGPLLAALDAVVYDLELAADDAADVPRPILAAAALDLRRSIDALAVHAEALATFAPARDGPMPRPHSGTTGRGAGYGRAATPGQGARAKKSVKRPAPPQARGTRPPPRPIPQTKMSGLDSL